MNWFKLLKLALRGEFWITDGSVISADDFAETNHEGHAMQAALSSLLDHFNIFEEFFDPNDFVKTVAPIILEDMEDQDITNILTTNGIDKKDIKDILSNRIHFFHFLDDDDIVNFYLEQNPNIQYLYEIAMGHGDARLYGMKELGWKRLESNNVETFTITPSDMDQIADGLYEAYNEEAKTSKFNIYVFSTTKWYTNVPFDVIASKNLGLLRNYMEKF
jgi:hypothetical protein